MEFWRFVFQIGQAVATIGVAIYVWWSNREKVTSQRFAALEKEVAERLKKADLDEAEADRDSQCLHHKNKTERIEKSYADLHIEVSRLPDRREITKLDGSIKELTEKLGNLDGRISGLNRVADLMNEFLINQGGKR
jgi:hypothetical protein